MEFISENRPRNLQEINQENSKVFTESVILPSGWRSIEVPSRVDAFNFEEFKAFVTRSLNESESDPLGLVFDLTKTRFLSLICIRYISELADQLRARKAQVALASPTEKLKRQIDIYGSLDSIDVVSNIAKL